MERRLLGDLMKSYNKLERPVSVGFSFHLHVYNNNLYLLSLCWLLVVSKSGFSNLVLLVSTVNACQRDED